VYLSQKHLLVKEIMQAKFYVPEGNNYQCVALLPLLFPFSILMYALTCVCVCLCEHDIGT
jgi:hypothetical protein